MWGTDFPHPNTHGFLPDDGDLANVLSEFSEADRQRLLVENPVRCFGFA